MQTKIYGIYGYTTTIIRIPAGDGKAYLNCEFTRGCPHNRANYRPATYATADKTEQDIIERSPLFNRQIKLIRAYGEPEAVAVKAIVAPATQKKAVEQKPVETPKEETGATDYPEVTTREEAIATLKKLGAKATSLRDDASIATFMKKNNITFSNFSF